LNESGFKQRLIGAAVLIALAVLFLPIILDGDKAQYFEQDLIPERPVDSELAELAASLHTNNNSPSSEKVKTLKSEKSSTTQNNNEIKLTGKEISLIVQVASFADENNALKLVQRLKSQKLKAFIGRKKVTRDGKKLSRVLIGPMLLTSEADEVMAQLKDNSDLKASIVEFDPVKH